METFVDAQDIVLFGIVLARFVKTERRVLFVVLVARPVENVLSVTNAKWIAMLRIKRKKRSWMQLR